MARITVEDCLEVVNNRFELVLMATKRARQVAKGAQAAVVTGLDVVAGRVDECLGVVECKVHPLGAHRGDHVRRVAEEVQPAVAHRFEDLATEPDDLGLGALWTSQPPANREGVRNTEPTPHAVPYVWHWRDLRPRALQAAALIGTEQAERRVLELRNPGITEYITLGSGTGGPDNSLINRAAGSGLVVDGWGIMTFDWGNTSGNQGNLTIQAADALKNKLKTAYGWSDADAYKHVGISSMNGITDEHATVTLNDMRTITAYAQQHTIARLSFWSLNRDR